MFLFFRKLRKKLIDEGRLTRYFLYGLGEIFLVVVGILIALQIDNWNDSRKEQELAIKYLEGIQRDLDQDVNLINKIIQHEVGTVAIISSVEDLYSNLFITDNHQLFTELFQPVDAKNMINLFRRGTSFRAIRGNYNSLISDGKSGLIRNRELFAKLQLIYDEQHLRLDSIYDSIKTLESQIVWQYPREKYQLTYEALVQSKDQKIFYDLANFTELKFLYCQWLILLREDIQSVQKLLKQEVDMLHTSSN